MPGSNIIVPHAQAAIIGPDGRASSEWYRFFDELARGLNNAVVGGGITTEDAVDAVAAALAAGTHSNISIAYNDAANSISFTGSAATSYSDEQAVDAVAAALAAGTHSNVTVTYNDAGNALSLASAAGYTDENAVDAVAAALAAGTHSGIVVTYDDAGDRINLTVDLTAPELSGSVTPSDETATTATITWPAATGGATGYAYSTDGGSSYTDAGAVLSAALSGLTAETIYSLSVYAYDAAGNNSAPITGTLTTTAAPVSTTLLLLLNGADGSTTFTDSSASAHTITATGGAAISTAQSRFGGASLSVASGARITAPFTSDLNLYTGDFTIQVSVYFNAITDAFFLNNATGTAAATWRIWVDSSTNKISALGQKSSGALAFFMSSSTTSVINTWYDVALVRSGTSMKLYVDGVNTASATVVGDLINAAAVVSAGAMSNGSSPLNGYLDHIRIKKGEAITIAPLTTEFTS